MKTVFGAAARGTTNRTICVRPTATTTALLTATTIAAFVLSSTPSVRITLITVWGSAYKVPMSLLLVVIRTLQRIVFTRRLKFGLVAKAKVQALFY